MSAPPIPGDGACTRPRTRRSGMTRVAVLGRGAAGGPVIEALDEERIPGAVLVAVADSRGFQDHDGIALTVEQLADRADLVVEAAGRQALTALGPKLVAAGLDLLVLSIGALADRPTRAALTAGPGRLYVSTGAIGGLDVIRALADAGELERITITSTKPPRTLVQDWMDQAERRALLDATARFEVMRGTPQQIATAFPRSANVAMAVAVAAGSAPLVEAAMFADPACPTPTHEISVVSRAGEYHFELRNQPSPDNPATSRLVPLAVIRALHDLAGRQETLL